MNFQDRSAGSVQSLLAQLRAAQDGGSGNGQPSISTPTTATTSRNAPSQKGPNSSGPSTQQLNDLLSSLGHQPAAPAASAPRRSLIEPFGPVAQAQPSRSPSAPTPTPGTTESARDSSSSRVPEGDRSQLSFTKALPIVSELLANEEFRKEIKRMKVDQDTLERRLWAKGEKIKAEHEKTTRTDKEMTPLISSARITGKPISPTKEREWRSQLSDQMQDFYRHNCLPAIDGLATRHRERLEILGVPGLGGDMTDPKVRDRVKRIMDVLEASLDE